MILLFVLVILLVGYWYLKVKYFTLRDFLPGLSPQFLVGNLVQSGFLFGHGSFPEAFASFKRRFGDVFQFWMGPSRVIVVNNINDVQYIFTHRHIYDQGDVYTKRFSIVIPHGYISNTGMFIFFRQILLCHSNVFTGAKYKRHAALALPLFRRGKVVSYFDMIVDCTEKLLTRWRSKSPRHVHIDIVQQCHDLLLAIFGFIAFDYDMETLDNEDNAHNNQLTRALLDFLDTFNIMLFSPRILSMIYFKLSSKYRRGQKTMEEHFDRMIEQELTNDQQSLAQRKRTSLIASLVSSLQADEKLEQMKSEEDKKGKFYHLIVDTCCMCT